MISLIKSWLYRKVSVTRADPNVDVALMFIDCADGSAPQQMLLSRNNLFALAWVVRKIIEDGKQKGEAWRDVSLTLEIPCHKTHEIKVEKIFIPDWARKKLYQDIDKLALSFGWNGIECPQPTPLYPFR